MLEILSVDPACAAGTPVVDSDGARVGTATEPVDGTRHVAVDPNAPPETLETLGWDRDAERATLQDRHVAADDDVLRLVV